MILHVLVLKHDGKLAGKMCRMLSFALVVYLNDLNLMKVCGPELHT